MTTKQHYVTFWTGMDMLNVKSAILDFCYKVSNTLSVIKRDAKDYITSPIFYHSVE
jgi:hypothetical protein